MKSVSALIVICIVSSPAAPGYASEWGCEVLLCAASDNPTWQKVQSCRPPMERLISAMKLPGFSWPTCPEGGAGKPGYDEFDACPSGWLPSAWEQGGDRTQSQKLSACSRVVDQCDGRFLSNTGMDGGSVTVDENVTRVYAFAETCRYTEFSARPLRDKPYYFDIHDDNSGAETRHFFSLQK